MILDMTGVAVILDITGVAVVQRTRKTRNV